MLTNEVVDGSPRLQGNSTLHSSTQALFVLKALFLFKKLDSLFRVFFFSSGESSYPGICLGAKGAMSYLYEEYLEGVGLLQP